MVNFNANKTLSNFTTVRSITIYRSILVGKLIGKGESGFLQDLFSFAIDVTYISN